MTQYSRLTFTKLLTSILIGVAILAATMLVCSLVGTKTLSIKNLIHSDISTIDAEIFYRIRLPRVLLASIVGASLAISGAVLQAILKNPLADPYILGISSGAGVGAMFASVIGLQFTFLGKSPIAIFAFIGALATVWLVWTIGSLADKRSSNGLLLTGVVINTFLSAITMFMVAIAKSSTVHSTMIWLMGNILPEDLTTIATMAILTLIATISLMLLGPSLNLISFSAAQAKTVGINVSRVRFLAFLITAFITSIAVSLSGLIGFVGLIVPHAIRLIWGADHRRLLPITAIAGAIFMVIADTIARVIISPAQLPVGILTAMIGGPFFIVLLIKNSKRQNLL